jgi:hypothetical protein
METIWIGFSVLVGVLDSFHCFTDPSCPNGSQHIQNGDGGQDEKTQQANLHHSWKKRDLKL